MSTAAKPKKLRISAAMTKAELTAELRKAQRWIGSAERKNARSERKLRDAKVAVGLANTEARKDPMVQELEAEVEAQKLALALAASVSGPFRLARVIMTPGAANENPDMRLTVDLILSTETDQWIGGYAAGYASSMNERGYISPFLLREDRLDWGFDSDEEAELALTGKPIRPGEYLAFSVIGESGTGKECYRVERVLPLLSGTR